MAKYKFAKMGENGTRWHPEMGQPPFTNEFQEYYWLDFVSDNGYYLRFSPFNSFTPGSNGITKGFVPAIVFDLLLPDGRLIDRFVTFENDFEPYEFGGRWGKNIFTGNKSAEGEITDYVIKYEDANIAIDLKGTSIAKGIQFSDTGYTYYNPKDNTGNSWYPVVPRAEVKGTITVDGKKVEVKGPAYLDHQASNVPAIYGGPTQRWWMWGHFFCGPYTATFIDSAADLKYRYNHFTPFVLWKGSEIILATFNFRCTPEGYYEDPNSGNYWPSGFSQRAIDGSIEVTAQLHHGRLCEPETTSLDHMIYVRQLADVDLQVSRFGRVEEQLSGGKVIIEFGAHNEFFPWNKEEHKAKK